jgi:ribose/xylose/arabinose/galactoside ABC-type transport system permease subunit
MRAFSLRAYIHNVSVLTKYCSNVIVDALHLIIGRLHMGFLDALNLLPMIAFKAALIGFVVAPLINMACRQFDLNFYINAGIVAAVLLVVLSPQLRGLYFDADSVSASLDQYVAPDALWTIMKVKFWAAFAGYCAGAYLFWKYAD